MTKKKNFILKVATFLVAVAPVLALSLPSGLVLVGEPQLPTKLGL